ncbi:nucleolin-like isoform X2 [Cotesia glomerata]|nr:nucleolin-like isoform X2 [Cotesia glomerata]
MQRMRAIFKHWLYTSVHACFLSTVKRDYHLGRLEYYLGRRIASIKNNVNGYQKRKSGSKQVSRDGASDGGNGHVGAGAGSSDGNGVPIDNEDTGDEGNHGKNDQSHENIEVEDEEEILIKLRKDVESENDKNDEEDKDGDSKDQVENEEEEEEEGDKSSLNSGDDDELLKLNKYDDFKNDSLFNDSYDSDDSRLFIADDE